MSPERTNYFSIVALGEDFDVDNYVQVSPLRINQVWHRGDARFDGTPYANSGISIELGSGTELDTNEQQSIAADFLRGNNEALKELGSIRGVESFFLGLQLTICRNSAGSIMDMRQSLMQLALAVGVQVTVWACLERESGSP